MKRVLFAMAAVWFAAGACGALSAQAPSGPAAEVQGSYNRLKPNVIKAAEKMPDADYQYKPTPDIRTYARIVNHITEAQQHTCSALNGTAFDPKSVPSDTADKATIVAALKASFENCDKAYGALTDANVAEMVGTAPRQRSRIGMAWGNVSHDNEQYAELSTYLRLKGLVPPTAEK
ncbi:MAG TPA: DinB family protein [Acidobacteriaceae bacterium]|nr:DinB family protein [Acidobacteriaceae bacterium]